MTEILDGPEVVEVDATGNIIEPEAFGRKKKRGVINDAPLPEYTDDFLDKCREAGISESVIRDGGDYRQLSKKLIYWLPLPELLEFELKDAATESDEEFWTWFNDYVDDKKLQTKAERTKKKQKHWDDWRGDFEWAPRKIGQWWSSWGYSSDGYSGSSALSKKLAIALKAINATVSVVNDTANRYRVTLAADDSYSAPTSYTSFDDKQIVVSPQALLDTSIPEDQGIEVTTGYGLHEASHVKYSTSVRDALTKPTKLEPLSVSSLLWNLLEDLRIEKLTAQKFPGFAEYFDTMNAYLWGVSGDKQPTEWGPDLNDKMNSVIGFAKWPDQMQPRLSDPSLAAEYPWWREWVDNYVNGTEPIRMGVIRALERLAEDPQTKQQMDDLTEQERAASSASPGSMTEGQFQEFLKQLKEMLRNGKDGIDPCPSPGPGMPTQQIELTAEQSQELQKLIEEDYQQVEAFYKMRDGQRDVAPLVEVSRPLETTDSRTAYQKPGGMVERLRSVFYFRKQVTSETERLLKNGFIDEDELWRAGLGDNRVFERAQTPEETFTSVSMLVDISGSMVGSGLQKAQELANVMMACLRTQRGVRTRVRAHSTGEDPRGGASSRIYKIWDQGDPDTRLGLLTRPLYHGSNYDGFAIDWCAKELNDGAQPGETKLLIVLSDGLPAGSFITDQGSYVHYGGGPAMEHMMGVVNYWERQDVTIVQIAIDADDLRPEDQARMFKHWIGYENDSKLLTDLTKLLSKTFGAVE